jgi:hypothetical protein
MDFVKSNVVNRLVGVQSIADHAQLVNPKGTSLGGKDHVGSIVSVSSPLLRSTEYDCHYLLHVRQIGSVKLQYSLSIQ